MAWSILVVSFLVSLLFLILHSKPGTSVTIPWSGYEAERKEVCFISALRSPVLLPSAFDLAYLPRDMQYLLALSALHAFP